MLYRCSVMQFFVVYMHVRCVGDVIHVKSKQSTKLSESD